MSDEESKPAIPTVRPPPGDEDVYSASTVVGPMPADLLAIVSGVRAEEERAAAARDAETGDSSRPTMVHPVDATVAGSIPRPPPMGSLKEDVAAVLNSSASQSPSQSAAMKTTPLASSDRGRAPAMAGLASAPTGAVSGNPIAPVVGIVVVFLAAVLALAALIR
ncbi:hypothetical protein AKJ09_08947 [Labilithrix luteola]|uniref:Uncharacterized protein n=1 Tax=Labilithrix luteola TaxID=1391654 RepID=A0A0K1Q973_9BACT|nr:hypothetical protein [Labilithrix luteola]AKV02284.1 hypothetical protein AKJ09_08947 [Labilithrix luteola]